MSWTTEVVYFTNSFFGSRSIQKGGLFKHTRYIPVILIQNFDQKIYLWRNKIPLSHKIGLENGL